MTVHISRDFHNYASNVYHDEFNAYALILFLKDVMQFSVIGSTNLDIETESGTWLLKRGTSASINQGTGDEYAVSIPSGQYTVSSSDVGRTIVIRSSSYPTKNSGLFHITSVDTINNWVYVDYRSPDDPPTESGLPWAIYESEESISFTDAGTGAGDGTYETQGAANGSRIILQSSSGWQVRLCKEGPTDSSTMLVEFSVSTGTGGDSSGDFQESGDHNHIAQYFNRTASGYVNTLVGLGIQTTTPNRIYIWGDTTNENVTIISRDAGGGSDNICVFGMTEDEETPLPSKIAQRTFVIGNSALANGLRLKFGFYYTDAGAGGCAYGLNQRPVSCVLASYQQLSIDTSAYFNTSTGAPYFREFSADSIFTGKTELHHLEVMAGTWDTMRTSNQDPVLSAECRRIGTCPMLRVARSNLGEFQLTTDSNKTWLHTKNGIYMPWLGPRILP